MPGIGPKFQRSIITYVYKYRLTDLHKAYRLYGIGEYRQTLIDDWIKEYQALIPEMLKDDFPGKTVIANEYEQREKELGERLEEAREKREKLQKKLEPASEAKNRLKEISWFGFYQALVAGEPNEKIGEYIRGIFAEWEEMPDWFKDVISQGDTDV